MLLAPCNRQIAAYIPAKKFASAGFCARQRAYMLLAPRNQQIAVYTPAKKLTSAGFYAFRISLPTRQYPPAGLYVLRASCNKQIAN